MDDPLTDRDMMGRDASADSTDGDEPAAVKRLRANLRQEREARKELEADLTRFKREAMRKINALEDAIDGTTSTGTTKLQQYATAPTAVRRDLSTNRLRAVKLYESWHEIAWKQQDVHGGHYYVNTATRSRKKDQPSRLKHELESRWNETLSWNDIYRTLQHVALMAGSDERVDEYGRTHIEGGTYEYHERANADGSTVKRILVEVGE